MKRMAHVLVVLMLVCLMAGTANAAETLKTCWMPEHETFLAWYAQKMGWDKEEGFEMEMVYFDSGMAQMEALPSGAWVVGATGGVPAVTGAFRYGLYVIGIGNNESLANAVMVRPDSPILKVKGAGAEYPDVYGDVATVKGKTMLVTTNSSAHYALSTWLKRLGLSDKDVVIKHMDQASVMAAYEKGIGDAIGVWAPYAYTGLEKGWKFASTPEAAKVGLPIVLCADSKWADAHPEKVAAFLRMYMRAIKWSKETPIEKQAPLYQEFMLDFAGTEYSLKSAELEIKYHPIYNLKEQMELFTPKNGGMSTAQTWEAEIAKFFYSLGKIQPADYEKVKDASFVTDKFLKLVKPIK